MTEEEKKAIKNIKEMIENIFKCEDDEEFVCDVSDGGYLQTALNLIQNQDKIIKNQSYTNKKMKKKLDNYRKLTKLKERKIGKQDTEINKLKEKLDITKTNYEILQGEMDRIGIDTLHLEAGSSTDDVIDEINKLNNVIDRMAEYMYKELDFAYSKEMVIEHFVKEDK